MSEHGGLDERIAHVIAESADEIIGIFILDASYEVVWITKATEEYFGVNRDEVVGADKRRLIRERIKHIFEDSQTFSDTVLATYDDNTYVEEFECHVLPADHRQERWLKHWSKPIEADPYKGGRIEHYTDITDRKRREEKLQRQKDRLEEYQRRLEESNERLEQFAHAASHDLKEPLRMISRYLTFIEDRYGDDLEAEGQEFLAFAVDGADRMREMIEGLLDYSRIETQDDPFETVDLEAVLNDVLANLEVMIDEHDAKITAQDLPYVVGDAAQLRQLFQNLLKNAMEYSGSEPPCVHISAEQIGAIPDSERPVSTENLDQWVISVADEGVGINPEDADRIFEVFQSLGGVDEHGSGIGLALCKRIVERHSGDIWVESEPGEGATFSFTLPVAGDVNE